MAARVRAEGLLPEKRDYLRLNGSLTTPPCTEGVLWLILRNPVMVSKAQVKQFTEVMGGPNNRPVQPLNARALLR
jgi:carbonic anhydrase